MVEKGDIFTNQPLHVSVAQYHHVIQALASDTTDEAQPLAFPSVITNRIGFGRRHSIAYTAHVLPDRSPADGDA